MAKITLTDIAAGYVLVSTFNANNTLIETALENTLSRDGTSPNTMSANLDMNSNRVVNVTDGTNNQDAATVAQLNAASVNQITTIDGIGNVDTTGVATGDLWYFDGSDWVDTAGAVSWDGTNIFEIAHGLPRFQLNETDQAADEKIWRVSVSASCFRISTKTDVGGAGTTALEIFRTGTAIDEMQLRTVIKMLEQTSAEADTADYGQFWVKDDAPNVAMFTDDAGGDQLLDPSISEINTQNGNYTLVLGDKGKTIHKASGASGETITIPANASVAFPVGTLVKVENDGGGTLSVAITTDTLTFADDNTTGTRTIADGGFLVIHKVTSTSWKCSGAQVT